MLNMYRHWVKASFVKKILAITLISLIILSICISAFAHSGRTDSDGGHYNRETGEYHYHTGEYVGRDSSTIPWYVKYVIYIILVFIALIIYLIWRRISESLPNVIIFNLEKSLCDYKNAKQYTIFCDTELKEIKEKAIIPNGYEIGEDGLPKEIDSKKYKEQDIMINNLLTNIKSVNINWGESLTVYTVPDGWKLHLQKDCCGRFPLKRNIYSFHNKRYSICKKCSADYQEPNMDWYSEYLKIEPHKRKCEIAKSKQSQALTELKNCFNACNTKVAKFLLLFSSSKKQKLDGLKRECKRLL